MRDRAARPAVIAADGGNSKTDLVLVDADGRLLAAVRGPTASHEHLGLEAGGAVLEGLARRAADAAGAPQAGPIARLGVYCLAGADFPTDVRRIGRALERRRLARATIVMNDSFAALRAGTSRPWGVVLICGEGTNAAGIAPDGRIVRLAGIGDVSGDWGGGHGMGVAALGAAVRARDGRGPRTTLERLVPGHFGLRGPVAVARAMRDGQIPQRRASELAPVLFRAAGEGDAVARGLVDRLADELGTMASAVIRRLHLTRRDVEVVLAGGVFRNDDEAFHARVAELVRAVAPRARLVRLEAPAVLGAALLGLDRLASGSGSRGPAAAERLRADLGAWRPGDAAAAAGEPRTGR